MNSINRFNPMIDALTQLAEEEHAHHTAPAPGLPTLTSVLADASPLPCEALFLGFAEDGLPVLLNLNDPTPGPILITGDQASGKTALLQLIARAAELLHSSSEIQYGIITQYPQEWGNFPENQINTGVYTAQQNSIQELLQSLFIWAHHNKGIERSILLLIDDLESLKNIDLQTEQHLRWLLLRGPSHHVWPIITVNAHSARNIEAWLTFFRTRLFGRVENSQDANFIAGYNNEPLNSLTAGSQFAMRQGNKWLKFWSPTIE